MANFTWKDTLLQPSDLPKKAQRFIEMMGIDTSNLTLMTLISCPDGKFIKDFDKDESGKLNHARAVAELDAIYFFSDYIQVGVAIHELMHIYLKQSRFLRGIEYDLRGMGEKFIEQNGVSALSNYARVSIYENAWAEVICEIVATYGRRGQFNKIQELLNQSTPLKSAVT